MSRLTDEMEEVLRLATERVNDVEELEPVWLLVKEDEQLAIPTPWTDDASKLYYLEMIRTFLALNPGVRFYVHAFEAWSADGAAPPGEEGLTPSQRDRQEVLVISGCTRDYLEMLVWTVPILREGAARRLGEPERGDGAGGRMLTLFPRRVQ